MIMAGGACTMQEPLPVDAALPALANAHYEALLPVERQAWFGLHRRAARTSAGGLGGVPGGARVGLRRSGERGKQITQVRLVRGTAQHGTELEDLFDRPQRRAVVIVD